MGEVDPEDFRELVKAVHTLSSQNRKFAHKIKDKFVQNKIDEVNKVLEKLLEKYE